MNTRTRARRHRLGRLLLPQLLFQLLLVGFFYAESAHAYTWMIRHNYTGCATCHADPSGGELLTQYGRVTADMVLRMQYGKPDPAKEPSPGVLWGLWEPPTELLISGSFRNLAVLTPDSPTDVFDYVPVMQADLYGQLKIKRFRVGGSLGLGKSKAASPHTGPAQVTTNQSGLNLLARNYYVGFDIGEKFVLRGGRLNLPFGVRMPEHTTWVREATRTDRESDQQHGVALSYVGERLRGEVMAILGNYQLGPDEYRERGYSLFVEGITGTTFGAGISSKLTYAGRDRLNTSEKDTMRQAHGVFSRWTPVEPLVFMFEMDALFRSQAEAGYAGFLQADYEPVTGLHFLLTGEVLDEGRNTLATGDATPGLGKMRAGGWLSLDWFFYKQFEFRVDAIFRQDAPFQMLGQLHLYL